MKYLFLIIAMVVSFIAAGQDKKICITVDDLPTVIYFKNDPDLDQQITDALTRAFSSNDVPAIGYVNEKKLYKNGEIDSSKVNLLIKWLENGLELGNHTFSHPNYHKVGFQAFSQDVLKGEKVIIPLSEYYGKEVRFFRHPYLRTGLNQEQVDSLSNFLSSKGYTEAPVTIDNVDYLFALAYSRAYHADKVNMAIRIAQDYIKYQQDKLKFYEGQSEKLFGRKIDQILLLHANLLNAHFMNELLAMYKKNGYDFVSQEEVLEDAAYQEKVTKHGDWGISWLDRWALSEGKSGDFFKGDPVLPLYIDQFLNAN